MIKGFEIRCQDMEKENEEEKRYFEGLNKQNQFVKYLTLSNPRYLALKVKKIMEKRFYERFKRQLQLS